ncbi:FAD-dependent oxidoreductase [Reyranella sp.]|uniref:FAD-dependent oxidoreductase n=1 Tax=Reyranella sp. TaxID=1929291 RepID=UPI003BA87F36
MTRPLEVGVVGCGVAGQALSVLLAEAGHRVTLFERFAEPRPVGAGLLLQPTGLAVLEALGLGAEARARGARVVGLEARTSGGRRVLDLRYADLHPEAFGLGLRRTDLFDLLFARLRRSRAQVITGREMAGVERMQLVEPDGKRHGPFELIVAADGTNSVLRGALMPSLKIPLYRWGCLWATVPDPEGLGASGLLQQRVRGTTHMLGLLPVAPDRLTLFWSLPVQALARERAIDLASFRREATALWPQAAPAIERATQSELARATYRHVSLPRWNAGPVIFLGDAAHGTSPQLGQGANLALMDAWALARSIEESGNLLTALIAYERRRASTIRYYQRVSHLLTPFFQSRKAPLGWLRDAFLGAAHEVPGVRGLMTSTLAGTRRGWFASVPLDAAGRYPLS